MPNLLSLLHEWNIPYQEFTHPAVFTCEESDRLCPPMPGAHTKQLLVRDKKGKRNILAIVMHDKKVDMRELGRVLGAKDLSFASPERLKNLLGVDPGSVTPFGLIFDTEHKVEIVVDEDAWAVGQFRFHPLVNTATLVIDKEGLETFLQKTGHAFTVIKIPNKQKSPLHAGEGEGEGCPSLPARTERYVRAGPSLPMGERMFVFFLHNVFSWNPGLWSLRPHFPYCPRYFLRVP